MISSLLLASAIYCFALAVFHLMFWRLIGWPASLAGSGGLNAGVTQTLNIMLTLGVVMYGAAICWVALHPDGTAWMLPAAGALFLGVRTAVQPFQFSMRQRPSQVIAVVFSLGALIHGAAAWAMIGTGA
jgi:uncharacterized membrane protein